MVEQSDLYVCEGEDIPHADGHMACYGVKGTSNAMTRQKWSSTLSTVGNFHLALMQWFGPNKPHDLKYHDEKTYTPKFITQIPDHKHE